METDVIQIGKFIFINKLHAERSRSIECLGDLPGKPFCLGFGLQVAGGEINANANFIIIGMRKLLLDILAKLVDLHYQFTFIMNVFRKIGVVKRPVPPDQGSIGLQEKDRVFRHRVVQFSGMVNIIPANADDLHVGLGI